jgi:UDP-2,3-diacylglucosamine hydrolase
MRYIIASDFHLRIIENLDDSDRRVRVEKFLSSLIGQIDGLILVGDIFDLWVEWDHLIVRSYFSVLKLFSQIREAGARLIYIAGNHDFWFGDFLSDTIGFEVYPTSFSEVINGKRVFVSHGDRYIGNDLRYKVFRYIVRSKIVHIMFKMLHPSLAVRLGQSISRSDRASREKGMKNPRNLKKSQQREQELANAARELNSVYDLVIFGHAHVPIAVDNGSGMYINTGDWVHKNSYVEFTESVCRILIFEF